ncbi:YfiT family bacillithiol transferase [Litchfieldia alkalitelluris]|uniref:YfiT family bacillithiol transferase n=1 Tax=Litchfieldia alkalitelluris TaxID=304268 RepID=UPI0009966518|nr:bacillithiol transferase BstA [Litchfieldia alkalitelluris]
MDLQYPIGIFEIDREISNSVVKTWIQSIENMPKKLKETVTNLTDEQLNTPYRPDGWTIRQVVHHLADSHMNAYIRFKLALTEENPIIKTYKEDKWAELPDSTLPIHLSISLLESLHKRWINILTTLTEEDLKRTFTHPELGLMPLGRNIGLYAWHGNHHIAHITELKKRMIWN